MGDLIAVPSYDRVASHLAAVCLVSGNDAKVTVDYDKTLINSVQYAPYEQLALTNFFFRVPAFSDIAVDPVIACLLVLECYGYTVPFKNASVDNVDPFRKYDLSFTQPLLHGPDEPFRVNEQVFGRFSH